jgi:hypothetical protein
MSLRYFSGCQRIKTRFHWGEVWCPKAWPLSYSDHAEFARSISPVKFRALSEDNRAKNGCVTPYTSTAEAHKSRDGQERRKMPKQEATTAVMEKKDLHVTLSPVPLKPDECEPLIQRPAGQPATVGGSGLASWGPGLIQKSTLRTVQNGHWRVVVLESRDRPACFLKWDICLWKALVTDTNSTGHLQVFETMYPWIFLKFFPKPCTASISRGATRVPAVIQVCPDVRVKSMPFWYSGEIEVPFESNVIVVLRIFEKWDWIASVAT